MKTETKEVSVKITGIDGKEVEHTKPVSYPLYETADDVLTALAGASKEVVDDLLGSLNYGCNLKARAKVTAQIKAENQGPEVAISRFVKQLVANAAKNGKTLSESDARAKVLANADIFGIDLTTEATA